MTQFRILTQNSALRFATIVFLASASTASAQQSFKSPENAVEALVSATKNDWPNGVVRVLGRDGADIVSSGDKVADQAIREKFLAAYNAKHGIKMDADDRATLVIGTEDFPVPLPLVRKDGQWRFDTAAGRQEILYRRIGRNELDAIQACLAYVDAQDEYAAKDRTGAGAGTYAERIVSHPGKKDGLYWPTQSDGDLSPLGELVAQAAREGYSAGGSRRPFHGYYFKVLTQQGPNAPGGAIDYVVHGKMIGGFALVAYPAEYGNSGVMTFLVNHTGVVYQKDLGARTAERINGFTWFNPNSTWQKVAIEKP